MIKWIPLIVLLLSTTAFGQITKNGVNVQNNGAASGHANTINCTGATCTVSGSVVTIPLSGGGGGGGLPPEGIQGSVQFLDVQGTVTAFGGNSGLTYTGTGSTSGNVGIGSLTPGQLLDVQGTSRALSFSGAGTGLTGTASSLSIGGNSATTTALSSSPTNCSSNQAPTGINASGIAQNCTAYYLTSNPSNYITGNQTITVTGDATGSGTTSIGLTLKNTGTAGTYRSTTFDAQGRETSGTNPTTFSGYGISDSSANLRAALTDSTGTGANVFATSPNLIANVGIGSVSPGQALDVNGTVRMTGFNLNSSPTSGFVLTSDSSGNGTWKAGAGGGVSSFSGDGLILNNSSSTGAVTATTAAQTQNTILGAATSTTLASLAVPSCSTGSSALTWTTNSGFGCNSIAGGTGSNYWTLESGSNAGTNGNIGIGTTYGVGIGTTFGAAGLSVMTGNVGIGTWNPNVAFQVGNLASFAGSGSGLSITSGGALYSSSTIKAGSDIACENSTAANCGFTNGAVSMQNGGGTANWNLNNTGSAGSNSVVTGSGAAAGQLTIQSTNVTGNADNILFKFGNLGIGTEEVLFKNGGVGIGTFASPTILNPLVLPQGGIVTQGNIGIGTYNPQNLLGVGATSNFQVSSAGDISQFSGDSSASLTKTGLNLDNGSGGVVVIKNNNSSGSGTGIEIDGSSHAGASSSSATVTLATTPNSAGTTDSIQFKLNQSLKMILQDNSGTVNVGIGSATPGQSLDINGTMRISLLGGTISIVQGTNACAGTGTLSTGTATVTTTCTPTTANGFILTDLGGGTLANIGSLSIGTVTSGTSFIVNSSNALDSSNFYWEIHKPTS